MSTLRGQAQSFPGATSDTYTTPFPVALGTKARDAAGNEYVFCQTGASTTVAPEQVVVIGSDWSVAPITVSAGAGPVGVVPDYPSLGLTSARVSPYPINTGLWIQIYGRCHVQYATPTGVASSGGALTTVRTSLAYRFHVGTTIQTTPVGVPVATSDNGQVSVTDFLIQGMFVATDATPNASGVSILMADGSTALGVTLVSATHCGSNVAVWINYPYVTLAVIGTSA